MACKIQTHFRGYRYLSLLCATHITITRTRLGYCRGVVLATTEATEYVITPTCLQGTPHVQKVLGSNLNIGSLTSFFTFWQLV